MEEAGVRGVMPFALEILGKDTTPTDVLTMSEMLNHLVVEDLHDQDSFSGLINTCHRPLRKSFWMTCSNFNSKVLRGFIK